MGYLLMAGFICRIAGNDGMRNATIITACVFVKIVTRAYLRLYTKH